MCLRGCSRHRTEGRRSARFRSRAPRAAGGSLDLLVASPSVIQELMTSSALKAEGLGVIVLAQPEAWAGHSAVSPLMQDLPLEAQRVILTADPAAAADLVERYARKALVLGTPPAEAPPIQPVGPVAPSASRGRAGRRRWASCFSCSIPLPSRSGRTTGVPRPESRARSGRRRDDPPGYRRCPEIQPHHRLRPPHARAAVTTRPVGRHRPACPAGHRVLRRRHRTSGRAAPSSRACSRSMRPFPRPTGRASVRARVERWRVSPARPGPTLRAA